MQTECIQCPLHNRASRVVWPSGPEDSPFVLVGEAPGAEEDIQGRPFCGAAGVRLKTFLSEIGGVAPYICNTCMCRPPGNRTPGIKEIKTCTTTHVHPLISAHPRKLVVALGASAWKWLSPTAFQRGEKQPSLRSVNAVVTPHPLFDHVMATYHPSATLRNENFAGPILDALRNAQRFLANGSTPLPIKVNYIDTLADATRRICAIPDGATVMLDVETTGLSPSIDPMTMIGLYVRGAKEAWTINWARIYREHGRAARTTLRDALVQLFRRAHVGNQNWQFDSQFIYRTFQHPIFFDGWNDDPMLQHYLLDENSGHGLKSRAAIEFGVEDYAHDMHSHLVPAPNDLTVKDWLPFPKQRVSKNRTVTELWWIDARRLAHYLGHDVYWADRLSEKCDSKLEAEGLTRLYTTIVRPTVPILARAELRGIRMDRPWLLEYRQELQAQGDSAMELWRSHIDPEFNPNTYGDVHKLLFERFKLAPPQDSPEYHSLATTDSGAFKVDEDNIRILSSYWKNDHVDYWLNHLLRTRCINKLQGTYIVPMLERLDAEDVLHTHFSMCASSDTFDEDKGGTVSGRLSSYNPNLQNIPPIIRSLFIAREGFTFLDADIEQTEVRGWALLSGCPDLLKVAQSTDVHCGMAKMIWPELASFSDAEIKKQHPDKRAIAKTVVFAAIYQASPETLAARASISVDAARTLIQFFRERFPRGWAWIDETIAFAKKHGYVVSYFGRRRRLPNIWNSDDKMVRHAVRQAVNSPVQGLGAEVCYTAGLQARSWLRTYDFDDGSLGAFAVALLNVHDAWVHEIRDEYIPQIQPVWAEVLKQTLLTTNGEPVVFPADVKAGKRWKGEPSIKALQAYINEAADLKKVA